MRRDPIGSILGYQALTLFFGTSQEGATRAKWCRAYGSPEPCDRRTLDPLSDPETHVRVLDAVGAAVDVRVLLRIEPLEPNLIRLNRGLLRGG
jgi:hypothetical protein